MLKVGMRLMVDNTDKKCADCKWSCWDFGLDWNDSSLYCLHPKIPMMTSMVYERCISERNWSITHKNEGPIKNPDRCWKEGFFWEPIESKWTKFCRRIIKFGV